MDYVAALRKSGKSPRAAEYEFRHLSLPRGTSRSAAHRLLTDQAEYGHWELSRVQLYPDGSRKVTLRRKIMRVRRSFSSISA